MEYRQHETLADFAAEARRVKKWYAHRRREWRRRRGPLRDGQSLHVRGARVVITEKMRGHFKRLFKPLKLEGLWAWAEIARGLHSAGIPVLSGTNPVEQFWYILKSMLPPKGKRVTLRWFCILLDLAFLRHNHRLFTRGALPQWAEGDSLLGQRLEAYTALCSYLHTDGEQPGHLQPIFDPFAFG